MRAYLYWATNNENDPYKVDFLFTRKAEGANRYETEHDSEIDRNRFSGRDIEIESEAGESFHVQRFQSEKLNDGDWVIFCEVPFWPTSAGPKAKTAA